MEKPTKYTELISDKAREKWRPLENNQPIITKSQGNRGENGGRQ